jgi:hypothetical protein
MEERSALMEAVSILVSCALEANPNNKRRETKERILKLRIFMFWYGFDKKTNSKI